MPIQDRISDNHIFEFNGKDIYEIFDRPLFRKIIESRAFRRLSNIHFLGGIDYLIPANSRFVRRHNRYQHTLAVASLAKRYAVASRVENADSDKVIAAALLHDIGHAPLSHSLESAFKMIYGLDHHKVGREMVLGVNPLGAEIVRSLEDGGIDPVEINGLIDGSISIPGADIFSREINVDTIEGVLRSARYLNCGVWLNPNSVLDALVSLDAASQSTLDQFWVQKGVVYTALIQSKNGAMADLICSAYMQSNKANFRLDDYWATEVKFRRCHQAMFSDLDEFRKCGVLPDYAMSYIEVSEVAQRSFYIDQSVELSSPEHLDLRYRQEKRVRKLLTSQFRRTGGGWRAVNTDRKGLFERDD